MLKRIINFIKSNRLFCFLVIIIFALFFVLNMKVPYYIYSSGGLINTQDKFEIEKEYSQKGSFNLSYVSEIKGNVLTYILSYILPNWDLVPYSKIKEDSESIEDVSIRTDLLLMQANQISVKYAYKKADKEYTILDNHFYVGYILPTAQTDLLVGDEIISYDGIPFNSTANYNSYIKKKKIGDEIILQVISNNKTIEKNIKVIKYEESIMTGIYILPIEEYITNPKIKITFSNSETGSSGGLMMALAIYNSLSEVDLTGGDIIAGTGTLNDVGEVGSIGGIKYKLNGAVKNNAVAFLVPVGENYSEAIKCKKEINADIEIIPVTTFNETVDMLLKRLELKNNINEK